MKQPANAAFAAFLAATLALLCPRAAAQPAPPPRAEEPAPTAAPANPPPAAPEPAPAPAGFQSQGIKATITSISLTAQRTLVIQFILQNQRKNAIYLTLVGGYGGSGGTVMATNGGTYFMNVQQISGITPCSWSTDDTDSNAQRCLDSSDQKTMTFVDAGQSTILGISYNLRTGSPATTSDTINFALKLIVRAAPGQGDVLSAASGSPPGPPSLVTISFPLIPLAKP